MVALISTRPILISSYSFLPDLQFFITLLNSVILDINFWKKNICEKNSALVNGAPLTALTKKIRENFGGAYVVRPPQAAKKKKKFPIQAKKGGLALPNAELPPSQLPAIRDTELHSAMR